jgi:D-alanyl-D-alanine carboxypeptidase (penicillin-binding protein 5/6)
MKRGDPVWRFLVILPLILLAVVPTRQAKADPEEDVISYTAGPYLLADAPSMQYIIDYKANEPIDAAGLVRLPAMLIICESIDRGELPADTMIRVSDTAAEIKGPTAFLEANENISVQNLLKSSVMISAGDSIYALAQNLSGTEQAFVQKLNSRLSELGISKEFKKVIDPDVRLSARSGNYRKGADPFTFLYYVQQRLSG